MFFGIYVTYDFVHGIYESVRATHGFFCGIYGVVRDVFSSEDN